MSLEWEERSETVLFTWLNFCQSVSLISVLLCDPGCHNGSLNSVWMLTLMKRQLRQMILFYFCLVMHNYAAMHFTMLFMLCALLEILVFPWEICMVWVAFETLSLLLFCAQDVTHKIVEAIGTIAGSSLEQTTWLRRNLEVKPSPQIIVDGSSLETDVEGVFFCPCVCVWCVCVSCVLH